MSGLSHVTFIIFLPDLFQGQQWTTSELSVILLTMPPPFIKKNMVQILPTGMLKKGLLAVIQEVNQHPEFTSLNFPWIMASKYFFLYFLLEGL